jgi:hypothetical protein
MSMQVMRVGHMGVAVARRRVAMHMAVFGGQAGHIVQVQLLVLVLVMIVVVVVVAVRVFMFQRLVLVRVLV